MPTQKIQFRVPQIPNSTSGVQSAKNAEANSSRLDQVLVEYLSAQCRMNVSRGQARKLIVAGAVYLNRKRVRIASKEVRPGAHIEVYLDPASLRESPGGIQKKITHDEFHFEASDILFEDSGIIVVRKSAGIPTQPTLDDARANLFQGLKTFLRKRAGTPDAYLGLHHRLDRDTSGLVLFTKDPALNAGVAKLFREHGLAKTYIAICQGKENAKAGISPGKQWVTRNNLGIVGKQGKKKKYGAVNSGGDPAETHFLCLAKTKNLLLMEAKPITGRTHQIRVHLSEQGFPIVGDPFYGGPENCGGKVWRVLLHAASLRFPHPVTGAELTVHCPIPSDFSEFLRESKLDAPEI